MNPKDLIGAKKSPLGVVPPSLLPFVAPAMAVGANKYGPFNWRAQPVQAMTYAEAAMRHLLAWIDGQDEAEDTGVSHIAHALAGLAILGDAIAMDNLIDNRPLPGPTPDLLREQDASIHPQDGEPKVYPVTTWDEAGSMPIEDFALAVDLFNEADGPVYEFTNGVAHMYDGIPYEELDGCVNYRGRHLHPSVATPGVFRDIDKMLAEDGEA